MFRTNATGERKCLALMHSSNVPRTALRSGIMQRFAAAAVILVALSACAAHAPAHKPATQSAVACANLTSPATNGDQCMLQPGDIVWNNSTDAATANPNNGSEVLILAPGSCTLGAAQGASYAACVVDAWTMANGYGVREHIAEGDTIYLHLAR